MKRCLIFGGSGFLGKNLCHKLLKTNLYKISVYNRQSKSLHEFSHMFPMVKTMTGDLEFETEIYSLLQEIDVIYYLISSTNASNKNLLLEFERNVVPMIRLLDACKERRIRLIFFSSGGTVYGLPQYTPIDEGHPTDPISPYGIHKLTLEKCIEYYGRTYGLDYRILRITNPYGMYQDPNRNQGAIAVFLAKAILRENIEIWGDGNAIRDYIFVSDVVDACIQLLAYEGPHRIFNISSGVGYSLNEIISEICNQLGHTSKIQYMPKRIQDVPVSILDNSLARRELQWNPKIDLQNGIRRMIHMWDSLLHTYTLSGREYL